METHDNNTEGITDTKKIEGQKTTDDAMPSKENNANISTSAGNNNNRNDENHVNKKRNLDDVRHNSLGNVHSDKFEKGASHHKRGGHVGQYHCKKKQRHDKQNRRHNVNEFKNYRNNSSYKNAGHGKGENCCRQKEREELTSEELMAVILRQIEYYFCDENLEHDEFFQNKINESRESKIGEFLRADCLLCCPRMLALRVTENELLEAIKPSKILIIKNVDEQSANKEETESIEHANENQMKGKLINTWYIGRNTPIPPFVGKKTSRLREARDMHPNVRHQSKFRDIHFVGCLLKVYDIPEEITDWKDIRSALEQNLPKNTRIRHVSRIDSSRECTVWLGSFDNDKKYFSENESVSFQLCKCNIIGEKNEISNSLKEKDKEQAIVKCDANQEKQEKDMNECKNNEYECIKKTPTGLNNIEGMQEYFIDNQDKEQAIVEGEHLIGSANDEKQAEDINGCENNENACMEEVPTELNNVERRQETSDDTQNNVTMARIRLIRDCELEESLNTWPNCIRNLRNRDIQNCRRSIQNLPLKISGIKFNDVNHLKNCVHEFLQKTDDNTDLKKDSAAEKVVKELFSYHPKYLYKSGFPDHEIESIKVVHDLYEFIEKNIDLLRVRIRSKKDQKNDIPENPASVDAEEAKQQENRKDADESTKSAHDIHDEKQVAELTNLLSRCSRKKKTFVAILKNTKNGRGHFRDFNYLKCVTELSKYPPIEETAFLEFNQKRFEAHRHHAQNQKKKYQEKVEAMEAIASF